MKIYVIVFLVLLSFLNVPASYSGQAEIGVSMPYWIDCECDHVELLYMGVDSNGMANIEFWLGLGIRKYRCLVIFVDSDDVFWVGSHEVTVVGFSKESITLSITE